MGFLGVDSSLTGRRWVGPILQVERQTEAMVQASGLPWALCAVMARLGVEVAEAAPYLEPRLRDLLPDPRSLKDMERAAARLLIALGKRERIAIFADYDVDGGSSAALLLDWMRQMGHEGARFHLASITRPGVDQRPRLARNPALPIDQSGAPSPHPADHAPQSAQPPYGAPRP